MREHHEKAVDRAVERFEPDRRFRAMIIGGSVVKDLARDDSDIDVMLVATDEEWTLRVASDDYHIFDHELCDYEGGYLDAKVMDLAFLEEVAEKGSEPARWAFVDAIIGFSRVPDLEDLLSRITTYPEHQREHKMKSFFAQMLMNTYVIKEAGKLNDRYALLRMATEIVLFGSRLLLAHNRMLYPHHKWMIHELRKAPDKPESIVELSESLLDNPCAETVDAYRDAMTAFVDADALSEGWVARYFEDREWTWRRGVAPVDEW
jgi:predicted nucleotidyltransferase